MNAILPLRHNPDDGSDAWRHVGEVIDDSDQVRVVGLRSVAFHRQLGCSWPNMITGDRKAGTP